MPTTNHHADDGESGNNDNERPPSFVNGGAVHALRQQPGNRQNIKTVLLLCGLPGAGKSTLSSHWASIHNNNDSEQNQHPTLSIAVLEYDQLQESLYEERGRHLMKEQQLEEEQQHQTQSPATACVSSRTTLPNGDETDYNEDRVLKAWRQSRQKALESLEEYLQQPPPPLSSNNTESYSSRSPLCPNDSSVPSCSILVLDDNFFLRSMRKQVYQVCQKQVLLQLQQNSTNSPHGLTIYFGIVWIDTPLQVCLERNQLRPLRQQVPEHVIRTMHDRFEAPPLLQTSTTTNNKHWEQVVLRLNGNPAITTTTTIEDAVQQQQRLLDENCQRLTHFVNNLWTRRIAVPPAVDPAIELQRLERERDQTRQSILHQADQYLRLCVQAVVQHDRSLAGKANAVRKKLMVSLQQQQQQQQLVNKNGSHPLVRADDLRSVKECFVRWLKEQVSDTDVSSSMIWTDQQTQIVETKLDAALHKFTSLQ